MSYKIVSETYLGMTAFLFLMFSLFIRREEIPLFANLVGAALLSTVMVWPVVFIQFLLNKYRWEKEESDG